MTERSPPLLRSGFRGRWPVLVAMWWFALSVQAQETRLPAFEISTWRAPAECGSREEFEGRVRQHLDRATETTVRADVAIERVRGRYRARLEYRVPTRHVRQVVARDCADARNAVALVLAIVVDPGVALRAHPAQSPVEPTETESAPAAAVEPPRGNASNSVGDPRVAVPDAPSPTSPPSPPASQADRIRRELFVGVGALFAFVPAVAPSFRLGFGVSWKLLRAHVDIHYSGPSSVRNILTLHFLSGRAGLGLVHRWRRLEVSGGALIEGGPYFFQGNGAEPLSGVGSWGAAGGELAVSTFVSDSIFVRLHGDVRASFRNYSFVAIPDGELFATGNLLGSAALELGLTF